MMLAIIHIGFLIGCVIALGLTWDEGYKTAMLQVKKDRIPVKTKSGLKHVTVKKYLKDHYDSN